MSAKPRMTVRMAPSRLHQLAWLARKAGFTPGEYARICLTAYCDREIAAGDVLSDWQRAYADWLAEQGIDEVRDDIPPQRAYDQLALRGLDGQEAPPPKKYTAATLPDEPALAAPMSPKSLAGREPRYEREAATIVRSFGPGGRKRRV